MSTMQTESAERLQSQPSISSKQPRDDSFSSMTKQMERMITVPSAQSYKDWLK
eukprot:CAMPEP_0185599460 /NCGR_PEP_ID=MMETSP0434-20130131/82721_1 /TAXON_ID=626734 ORGANISM="Favella taraikaensis, Strain Fe Narragansett Bay" /NCGR_SAMPLE_ID=MMETSP0434 /ASSEMBLY_ACC=CAM_ASM_000379 /LENGTH=52 /DNA_ID=CAMNT_0028228871 /DNA_START=1070 /DNA_END=1231 /DNA_ORIENTATION=-